MAFFVFFVLRHWCVFLAMWWHPIDDIHNNLTIGASLNVKWMKFGEGEYN